MNYQTKTKSELIAEIYELRRQLSTHQCSNPVEIKPKIHNDLSPNEYFIDNLPVIIGRINKQQQHLYINPVVTHYINIPRDFIIGKTIRELSLPDTFCTKWETVFQSVLSTGKKVIFEHHFTNRFQFTYYFRAHVVPEYDDNGTVQSAMYIVLDITDHKNIEATYYQQHQLYKTLAENAPLTIARVDTNFRFIYLNPTFTSYTGIPYQDCIGKLGYEVGLSDKSRTLWKPKIQELFNTGQEFIIESEYFNYQNGTTSFYRGHGVPEFDENGTIKSALCLILDNTKQKSLELNLRMRQQEFEALVTNAPDIISRVDKDFRIVYINPAVEKLTGFPVKAYINKKFIEIIGVKQSFIELWHKHLTNVFNNKKHATFEYDFESENMDMPGKHYYHTRIVPEFAADGSVEYALCISHDITTHKQMSCEMARLDRLNMVGEMAAGIGHEVRNPMTTVRGFLQMMLRKNEHEDQSKFFNIMIEELDRANSIITEFLSLAKNKPVDLKMQNINTIITALLPLMQANGLVNNKYIHTELNEIPALPLDEKEIRQLILNLVHNGIEAMSAGGNLYIKTYKKNNTIILAIKDEGPGIPTEVLKKIGTPFFTTKEHGTGLGLAVCYSIAGRHNATIHPETGPHGTTFYVRFKEKPIISA